MDKSLAARLALAASSTNVDVLTELGFDLATAHEHVESAWCFQRAAQVDERWAFNYAHELIELKRYEAAVSAFARAADVGHDEAWDPMGWCLEQLGDLAGAMRAYDNGLAEGNVDAGMSKAILLRELGERALAFELVIDLAAQGSEYADAVAACWAYDTSLDSALEDRLRAGAEHFPSARADLADLFERTGRLGEARQVLQRGVDLGEVESFLPLGKLLADEFDEPVAAEATYRAGIAAGETNCHNNLGVLFEEQNRMDDARQQYELGAAAGDALAQRHLRELDEE